MKTLKTLNRKTKTLVGFRHSLKDKDNNISPEGLRLAEEQGVACREIDIDLIFVGPMIRTRQTAEAFIRGYGRSIKIHESPISGIGEQADAAEVADEEFKKAIAGGMGNFDALLHSHDVEGSLDHLFDRMASGLDEMFGLLEAGQIGAYFGHSPFIELAAGGAYQSVRQLPEQYRNLLEMAAIVFEVCGRDEDPTPIDMIPAPKA